MLGRMGLVPPMLVRAAKHCACSTTTCVACCKTAAAAALHCCQSRVHPKTQTPVTSVLFCGAVSAVLALLVPIGELADLTSLGALFAFCCVSAGVIFRCGCRAHATAAACASLLC